MHSACAFIESFRVNLQMLIWAPLQSKEVIMLTAPNSQNLAIEPNGILHFINQSRQRLSFNASSGFLWLTRDGDIKDYMLRAGDAVNLCAGDHVWLTLIEADQPGSLTLEPMDVPRLPAWSAIARLFSTDLSQSCLPKVQPKHNAGQ
jgi:hypothetical protein